MAMDFSGGAGAGSPIDLIPNGQLAWAIITYREQKTSASTGTVYHDLELTLDAGQPFERRKLWHNLMDPLASANSDAARQMGMADITRILEAGRWATNPNFDQAHFAGQGGYSINAFQEIDGLRVAIKIKVEKGSGGYADKNAVAEFLSPNPVSSGHRGWKNLIAGKHNATPAASPQGGFAFGASQTAPAQSTTAVPAGSFGNSAQPAAGGAAAPASPTQTATPQPAPAPTPMSAAPAASATVSPSEPASAAAPATPTQPNNWMAQANQTAAG